MILLDSFAAKVAPKMFWINQQKIFSLEAYFWTKESFCHVQAHYRTIHTLLLAFRCHHQLVFALFGSCMGIGATSYNRKDIR
jgi:hypothetical protein